MNAFALRNIIWVALSILAISINANAFEQCRSLFISDEIKFARIQLPEKDLALLEKALSNKSAARIFSSSYRAFDTLKPAYRSLLKRVPLLSDVDRKQIALKIKLDSTDSGINLYRELLALGTYDRHAWKNTLDRLLEINKNNFSEIYELGGTLNGYLPALAKSMPPQLSAQIINFISSHYQTFRKSHAPFGMAPKRVADSVLKHLLRFDLDIRAQIKSGEKPIVAFRNYIRDVHQKLGLQLQLASRDLYTAEEVVEIVHVARESIGGKIAFAHVGGSLVNGRGFYAKSDLDLGVQWIDHNVSKSLKGDLIAKIGEKADKLEVSMVRTDLEFWGRIQPVAFEISNNQLWLIVLSPNGQQFRYLVE